MSRIIGIRHRWKDLAGKDGDEEGQKFEEKPTLVFLLGKFPTSWRALGDTEYSYYFRPDADKDISLSQ